MTEVRMPKLSDSMEQGLVLQWLIEDGQPVAVGDELVEIETDKATMTYEADVEGVLEIVVAAGTTVAVGELIAHVGVRAEPAPPPELAPAPAAVHATNGGAAHSNDRPLATPVARRLAAARGVSLSGLAGSGPRGRVTKADVLGAAGTPVPTAPPPRGGQPQGLTRTQRLIARRMAEAKATIPHFQVQTEVVMDRALGLRAEIKELEPDDAPSINDLIVRACALALRKHPRANGSYVDERFELHERVNVGVAVATDDALIVPTVFDADAKTPRQIAAETRRLAERVRTQQITPPELSGATFTVSNLGMYGMTAIAPVINPPHAAILGVGAVRQTLAREGAEIVDRALLTLTLSCDHRILYGADAARFLAEIKSLLEIPLSMFI